MRLKVSVSTNKVGSNMTGYVEIPDEELEMLENDPEMLGEIASEKMWEMINLDYEIVE